MSMRFAFMTLFAALLTGCTPSISPDEDPVDSTTGASIPSDEHGSEVAGGGKTLAVFFSSAGENWQVGVVERGNTAIMADYIVEATGADVFEIVPEVAYPSGYEDCKSVATSEKNSDARPKFKGAVKDISQYTNVFIGGPVWWAEPPMILHTFCEAYPQLKDKTIIPFGTHGGSGVGSYKAMLQKYYPDAKYLESLGINGSSVRSNDSKTSVTNWVKKIGLEKKNRITR